MWRVLERIMICIVIGASSISPLLLPYDRAIIIKLHLNLWYGTVKSLNPIVG